MFHMIRSSGEAGAEDLGVSSIMVIGGSGDFFPVADTVVCMERYRATDMTEKARAAPRDSVARLVGDLSLRAA